MEAIPCFSLGPGDGLSWAHGITKLPDESGTMVSGQPVPPPRALAVFAHPDDIEFVAAGTLLLLAAAGWETHYLNVSGGDCGSMTTGPEETRRIRAAEGRAAATILGATFHEGFASDLLIFYDEWHLRRLAAIIRRIQPSIVLTHAPADYMEDHMNTSRLAVTAAFARGMPNFVTDPVEQPYGGDVTVYHALPHGLRDGLRQSVKPDLFVDVTAVQPLKREALAAHVSQKAWLDVTQGMNSYLDAGDVMSQEIGRLSGRFRFAEGWRRHSHLGFSATDADPLAAALPPSVLYRPGTPD
jgi:LmbE family N-acetylglucosaminyl deacetylase